MPAAISVRSFTAHRLLAMLVHHGFVQRDPQSQDLPARTDPAGDRPRRRREVGRADEGAATVGRPGRTVQRNRSPDGAGWHAGALPRLRRGQARGSVATRAGSVLPANRTSGGKALLAELSDDRLRALYADSAAIVVQTDRSLSSLPLLMAALPRSSGPAGTPPTMKRAKKASARSRSRCTTQVARRSPRSPSPSRPRGSARRSARKSPRRCCSGPRS